MNKTAIKNFAVWARNKLIAEIVYKAGLLGVTDKGIAPEFPESLAALYASDSNAKFSVSGSAKVNLPTSARFKLFNSEGALSG